jgi:peptidoglycan/xylan/chitin deacetylase (PgdA/CDA1 family)
VKLTILMYHAVAVPDPGMRHLGNFINPKHFVEQLDLLLELGYRTISFDDWLAHRAGRPSTAPLPAKPLIMTFDDGYLSFDTTAWPALRARHMGATVFLVAGQLGGCNAWDADEVKQPLLDHTRILELQQEGVRFESHTFSHVPLGKVPADVALEEMHHARMAIEGVTGRPVTVLSYPFSNQNRHVRALARRAGYLAAVCGKGKTNTERTDPLELRRIKFDYLMPADAVHRVLEQS